MRHPLTPRIWLLVAILALAAGCHGDDAPGADGQVAADAAITADASAPRDAAVPADAAPPVDAAPAPPVTVAVIADLNGSYGSTTYSSTVHNAVSAIIDRAPDLVLSAGDMVAGQQSGLDYEAMWTAFHAAVTDPLTQAGIPLAVTPGNHDASAYSSFTTERDLYEQQWLAHRPDVVFLDDAGYPFRYAFAVGPVLFVSLDDTTVGPLSSDQRTWLDALLTQYEASYDVRVVFGHIPLYPVGQGVETEVLNDTDLEALLEAHQVTLFVTGHHHAYFPGRRATVRHLAMACLGSGPRALVGDTDTSLKSFVLFTVQGGAVTDLEAWAAPDFTQIVPRSSLPETVGSGDTAYTRDDL